MYLDCVVDIPDSLGKFSKITKGGTVYVRYVAERTYNAEKKYTSPNYRVIGELVGDNKIFYLYYSEQKACSHISIDETIRAQEDVVAKAKGKYDVEVAKLKNCWLKGMKKRRENC